MQSSLDVSKADSCQKSEMLKYAAENRRFEIERFWQRSLFFWGFVAAAFVAYFDVQNADYHAQGNKPDQLIPLLIACFGFICSVAWTLMNRANKYWQEAWEKKVKSVELSVLGANLFSNIEPHNWNHIWAAARYSPSKLAVALSDFTVISWLALAYKAFPMHTAPAADPTPYAIVGVTVVYTIGILLGGRSGCGSE